MGGMKVKTQIAVDRAVDQVCGKVRDLLPRAVEMAGEDFTGELTIRVQMNCGGMPNKPRVAFEF